jgi:nicotinate-nucleotide pyrophosphorylase (carboxylating)
MGSPVTLDDLLRAALEEDVGPGDLATESTIPASAAGRARILAKESVIVAGHAVAARMLELAADRYGGAIDYKVHHPDGEKVEAGTVIADVSGSMRGLLVGERPALNLLMRMCGIATWTRTYVDAAQGTSLRVVDTRKTTPLWRAIEKYAVRMGGGHNHRMGLFDGCMLKDNHITAVGGITEAVRLARERIHHLVRIQVECATLEQVAEAVDTAADSLMFENMNDEMLGQAVAIARAARPELVLEASGNMNPERIAAIAGIGLDVVSAGGLIHQARWADLSMKVQK